MAPPIARLRSVRLLKDPLLHFMVAGAIIFFIFAVVQPPRSPVDEIIVTEADVSMIAEQYRQSWRSEPSAAEMGALIDSLVLDEVLYREAIAMGLDQGDTVIRQRLRQKLEFILNAAQQIVPPTDGELRAWFDARSDFYTPLPTLMFDQVLLDNAPGTEGIRRALAAGIDPATLGRATQLPLRVQALSSAVDASFGPGFSDELEVLPTGSWSGPVKSSYGLHLVRVIAITRGMPDFVASRDSIEADWMQDAAQRRLAETYGAMRDDYVVHLPGDPAK